MFSYVFMKILEARPASYDRWMRRLSGGRVGRAHREVAALVPRGARVLEVGCGTGELLQLLCARGAQVEAFDPSPAMCAATAARIAAAGLGDRAWVRQMGVEGMDQLDAESFDAVVSTLVLSELHDDERRFALEQARRVLAPDGVMVVADEVVPPTPAGRALHAAARWPALAATFLVTGSSTRPVADLVGELERAGLLVEREQLSHGGAFCLAVARRPGHPHAEEDR
ncbi:MAG: class I SAM-dependent methyltransferase [Deltaproteobacteria bacterium]|jgi:demethylmenaquinone methyltransferase/2-methoxy-6-polyprenyl-1,4-benzoquinol methylase|nr:class I SAM-dependent methyltransferase [Deltaproteobacteria bacterium]MBW2531105.1 class I SAM-dependent methyltransferase [Deltaproteobacteria bacterium]